MYQLHYRVCIAMPLDWVAVIRLKITKRLIQRAFSDFPRTLAPPQITHRMVL